MSSSPALTAPALTTPVRANLFAAAVIFGLFVLASIVSAEHKDVRGFDEVAHASYVASIQQTGNAWPALDVGFDGHDYHVWSLEEILVQLRPKLAALEELKRERRQFDPFRGRGQRSPAIPL